MLTIISDAMRIATRNDKQIISDRERYLHRRASEKNDAEFHHRMLQSAARNW